MHIIWRAKMAQRFGPSTSTDPSWARVWFPESTTWIWVEFGGSRCSKRFFSRYLRLSLSEKQMLDLISSWLIWFIRNGHSLFVVSTQQWLLEMDRVCLSSLPNSDYKGKRRHCVMQTVSHDCNSVILSIQLLYVFRIQTSKIRQRCLHETIPTWKI